MKEIYKIVKESKLFFLPFFPPPQFYYFRSSFLNSLLHNFNISPQFFFIPSATILIFSLPNVIIPSSTILLFSLLLAFKLLHHPDALAESSKSIQHDMIASRRGHKQRKRINMFVSSKTRYRAEFSYIERPSITD